MHTNMHMSRSKKKYSIAEKWRSKKKKNTFPQFISQTQKKKYSTAEKWRSKKNTFVKWSEKHVMHVVFYSWLTTKNI